MRAQASRQASFGDFPWRIISTMVWPPEILLFKTFGDGEAPRAIADNHDVIGAFENCFREFCDILDAANSADGTRAIRWTVHATGVEFHFAFFIGQSAVADGVVVGIVFDD